MTPLPSPAASPGRLPLSVCMIVRDEERHLAAALASVRDVAGELVVVDTGSTDRTVAIAESFGARVLHHAWSDDFAAARNVALAAASCDWILSLDADQRLPAEAVPALVRAVRRRDCLAQSVTIRLHGAADEPALSAYAGLRLFRRDPRVRYAGRVHEDVADSLLAIDAARWPDSGVWLSDGGYADADERQRKRARNLRLLRRSHAEDPAALYPAYKLAITLEPGDVDERRAVLRAALAQAARLPAGELRGLPFMPRLVALGLHEEVEQGRLVDVARAGRDWRAILGDAMDFDAGVALARAGLFAPAREWLEAFVARPHGAGEDPPHGDACRWLAWMARRDGRPAQAFDWLRRGHDAASSDALAGFACDAVELHLDAGELAAAARALDDAAAHAGQRAGALRGVMRASALLAQAAGDLDAALELARAALDETDDDAAALLATLEIQSGPVEPARLAQHHAAIAGRRFDTLALKRLIGDHLGLAWPHELPAATLECLRALRAA